MKLVSPKKLWNALCTAKAIGGVIASFVLGAASVVVGFYIALRIPGGKLFSVPVTSIGCFLSGAFFAWQIKKVIDYAKSIGAEDNESNAQLKNENTALSAEIEDLKTQCSALKGENEQLKRQRISIDAFTPIFQAALIEADMEIKDVRIRWDKGTLKEPLLGKPTCEQYIGVLQDNFKAKYGVNFKEIRVWTDRNSGKVKVDGVKACHIGDLRDKNPEWLVCERQKFQMRKGDKPVAGITEDKEDCFYKDGYKYSKCKDGSITTTIDENELAEGKKEQADKLSTRISSCECKELILANDYAVKMGKELVKFMLGPYVGGKEIEFVDSLQDGVTPLTLEGFIKQCCKESATGTLLIGQE